jgi:DNA-binding Lrp family transcriptional regulator
MADSREVLPGGRTVDRSDVSLADPVNRRILSFSEDSLAGFQRDPIGEIAVRSGLSPSVVTERIVALLKAGVIRRVRQTLLTHNLAEGALMAWRVPENRLDDAFGFMSESDPFTGHVVIRRAEAPGPGSDYRLWTTLKVPRGYSPARHCEFLKARAGAEDYAMMPALAVFTLGVGHIRRQELAPGAKTPRPAPAQVPEQAELSGREWDVLFALKREFRPEEIGRDIWGPRAAAIGISVDEFCAVAEGLAKRSLLGRFSTFLEHSRSVDGAGAPATRHSALVQWAVPPGQQIAAGGEVARHMVLTHCYWRDAGARFGNVNIMGMIHGLEKESILAHKRAIDAHLDSCGFTVNHTAVLWSVRADIRPSEIDPAAYEAWCRAQGIDAAAMAAA